MLMMHHPPAFTGRHRALFFNCHLSYCHCQSFPPGKPPLSSGQTSTFLRGKSGTSLLHRKDLPPLPRAIYLLYLHHPEGIAFKDLPDYTDELREIYWSMKLRTEAPKKVEKSIIDVTNPLDHSIIEKCSRIRRSFLKVVPKSVAKHYIIVGGRAETKRILLDRKLVIWEKKNPPLAPSAIQPFTLTSAIFYKYS